MWVCEVQSVKHCSLVPLAVAGICLLAPRNARGCGGAQPARWEQELGFFSEGSQLALSAPPLTRREQRHHSRAQPGCINPKTLIEVSSENDL